MTPASASRRAGEAFTSYSFTVSGSGGTNWELRQRVDFSESQNSQFDFVWLRLTVTHSGSHLGVRPHPDALPVLSRFVARA